MTTKSISTHDRLLEAALNLLSRQNINSLTLDNVAKEAGVSKGGLLHHFRSKEALIEGLLNYLFTSFEARVQHYYDAETDRSGRWLRAYIYASFEEDHLPLELTNFLLSAINENTSLLTRVQTFYTHWANRLLNDGIPPARAMIIHQATDAYWIDRSLQITPDTLVPQADLINELLRLTENN